MKTTLENGEFGMIGANKMDKTCRSSLAQTKSPADVTSEVAFSPQKVQGFDRKV
jgi:hypothetical protein